MPSLRPLTSALLEALYMQMQVRPHAPTPIKQLLLDFPRDSWRIFEDSLSKAEVVALHTVRRAVS